MADNDQLNEEYQFSELDPMNANVLEEEQEPVEPVSEPERKGLLVDNKVKRNAMIAVVVFFVLMLLYKFIGSFMTDKKTESTETKASISSPLPVLAEPKPVIALTPPPPVEQKSEMITEVHDKLSAIETNQANLSSEVTSFGSQVGNINTNIEVLSAKIADLNQVISALNDKLENQARTIEQLSAKPVVKIARHPVKIVKHFRRYHLQAVIPGRAWIVATDGSTLTVREGSIVPGYGVVKLIDSLQGRVLTSSGQVIRFSQEDS